MKLIIRGLIVLLFMLQGGTIYGEQKQYNVGLQHISTFIQSEDVEMHIMVWYPTSEHTKITPIGPYEMKVAKNANVEPGNRSLIIISHGDGGSHLSHRDTAAYLAKMGYIVAAVLHPHNNFLDNSEEGTLKNLINRPREISKAIDLLLSQPGFKENVNVNRIAVIGHSAGAYTALALAGGIPNMANIREHCNKHHDGSIFCNIFKMSSQQRLGEELIKNTRDPRIKAAILMAPVGVLFNDDQSLVKVNVPIRIYRAEKDDILRYPYHASFLQKKLLIESEYVVVKNAGHYSFITPIPDQMKNKVGKVANDPNGFDRVQFHTTMNQEIADFLSSSLSR
jgi:predicted dienelactone hydrolase